MAKSKEPDVSVREIIQSRDLDTITRLDEENVEQPWMRLNFSEFLTMRDRVGLVIETTKAIVAYMLYERTRDAIILHKVVVTNKFRRKGLGTILMDAAACKLDPKKRKHVEIIVRERNLPAQLFLKACKFKAKECLADYFDEPQEDGYLMIRTERPGKK